MKEITYYTKGKPFTFNQPDPHELKKSMIQETFKVSMEMPRRTKSEVFLSLVEEVGELATELSVDSGYSKKPEGKDGITGEAVDVIICALDLIWVHNHSTTEEELEKYLGEIIKTKLAKWRASK
jgi:hypothetical protein